MSRQNGIDVQMYKLYYLGIFDKEKFWLPIIWFEERGLFNREHINFINTVNTIATLCK